MVKKVAVVILNFKVKDEALKCIESVIKSSYKNVEIIAVDNASEDGFAEEVKKFTDIIFIQNKKNLGFSGGNNIGIKKALDNGCDYVFILNPDTILAKVAVASLVAACDQENIGIAGPKILFSDRKTIWYAGGTFNLNNVLGGHRGVDEIDQGQYERAEMTDYISGGAMFVRRDVFKKIGLFDEKYFLYYEDSDFCFRAKKAGFKIMYVPQAVIYHKNAQSTGLGSPLQDYYITRNRMLFASKFLPIRTRFALMREALRNLKNPMRRMAFFDYLMGNFGKGNI